MLDGWACTAHCTALLYPCHQHTALALLHLALLCTLQFPPRSHRSLSRSWPKGRGCKWHVQFTREIFHWIWHGWKTGRLSPATSASHHLMCTLALWRWRVWSVVTAATTRAWRATLREWPPTQHISPSVVTHLTLSSSNPTYRSGLLYYLTWSRFCSGESVQHSLYACVLVHRDTLMNQSELLYKY